LESIPTNQIEDLSKNENFIQNIVKQMYDYHKEECSISIRISGMILSTSNDLINIFLKYNGLKALEVNLYNQSDKNTRLQTLWALSNIGAGTDTHIQSIISNNQII
jgi:hypothetical protein